MRIIALAIAAAFVSAPAMAADAKECLKLPGAVNGDGDAYCSNIPADMVYDSATKTDGFKPDCDDTDSTIFPGAKEVYGDAIDQDCNGSDAELSVSGPTLSRWQSGPAYSGRTWDDHVFETERKRCEDAAEMCENDDAHGEHDLSQGYLMVDLIHGIAPAEIFVGSVRFGQDGIREVVSLETWESYRHLRGASSGSRGLGRTSVQKMIAADAEKRQLEQDKVDAAQDAKLESLKKFDAKIDKDLAKVEKELGAARTDGTVTYSSIGDRMMSHENAFQKLDAKQSKLAARQKRNEGEITKNTATAPLVEVYAIAGTAMGRTVNAGRQTVRKPMSLGVGGGVNFGSDLPGGRANIFVDTFVGGDGGDGPAFSWSGGFEGMRDFGNDNHLGLFGSYSARYSNSDSMNTAVIGRQLHIGVGGARAVSGKDNRHRLVFARAGVGPEVASIAGIGGVGDDVGLSGRVVIGVGGGVGDRN
jgi:hypothetical protein